ncbi:MAG: hypothetical protein WAL98_01375 [Desulfatiglandaceae bacterium]
MYQGSQTMREIIDKTKGKINQAVGDLTGRKGLKRLGERDERKVKSKAMGRVRSARSKEESETDPHIQQSEGRKLP